MAHGTSDWGLVGPKRTVFGLDDVGEAAVRLGSPHLWDRRGDSIIIDNFGEGLGMARPETLGAGAEVNLIGGRAFHGAFCANLIAGSDGLRQASLRYYHGLPLAGPVGLEFSFTLHADVEYLTWEIHWHLGASILQAEVQLDYVNSRLEWEGPGGVFTAFATAVTLDAAAQSWNTGKLVGDFERREYVRFLLNGVVYDLTGNAVNEVGGGSNPHLVNTVELQGAALTNPSIHIDRVIVTQNEP